MGDWRIQSKMRSSARCPNLHRFPVAPAGTWDDPVVVVVVGAGGGEEQTDRARAFRGVGPETVPPPPETSPHDHRRYERASRWLSRWARQGRRRDAELTGFGIAAVLMPADDDRQAVLPYSRARAQAWRAFDFWDRWMAAERGES